jgi:hypothetical protein
VFAASHQGQKRCHWGSTDGEMNRVHTHDTMLLWLITRMQPKSSSIAWHLCETSRNMCKCIMPKRAPCQACFCLQGSGKTLAFGLPILQRLMLNKEGLAADEPTKLRALILAPTRELALQVLACSLPLLSLPDRHFGVYYSMCSTMQVLLEAGAQLVLCSMYSMLSGCCANLVACSMH